MRLIDSALGVRLRDAKRVLIAGAGGGYDIYCGLPLYLALRGSGREVHLANLSFTSLADTNGRRIVPAMVRVDAATTGAERYFPERDLCEHLARGGDTTPIHCFEKVGVVPLREAFRWLVREHDLDAIVLVDGGTDILMRGDEPGLGTPAEDMTSLAAVAGLDEVPHRLVACLGFGIDAFHGVQHTYVLEAIAELQRAGGFLGAFSLLPTMPEVIAYCAAVEHAHMRMPRGSIVNAQIAAALRGEFGNVQQLERTSDSTLFVNPLMSMYWAFELDALAKRSLYLGELEGSHTVWDVQLRIEAFRNVVPVRPKRPIPL